jgi:hypothetical protein
LNAAQVAEITKRVEPGTGFILADTSSQRRCWPRPTRSKEGLNAGSVDEGPREEECRANIKHTVPTRAMLADALAQVQPS